MKKTTIIRNTDASAYPVMIFIIALGMASMVILILGFVVEPFTNLMNFTDTEINNTLSAPREGIVFFITEVIWPKGVLLGIFIALSVALLMEYQKKQYKET